MINLIYYFLIIISVFISSCQFANKNVDKTGENNIAAKLFEEIDSSYYYLDPVTIDYFIKRNNLNDNYSKSLEAFYKKRNYSYAWINHSGINEFARNFINLLNQKETNYRNDSLFYNDKLHKLFKILSDDDYAFLHKDSLSAEFELILTANFFDYATRNWGGISDENLKKTSWFIDRKKLDYENLLDTILNNSIKSISSIEPVYKQYGKLRRYLQKYNDIEKSGEWPVCLDTIKKLQSGDTSFLISTIKRQLYLLEDLAINDTTILFNNTLEAGVKKFQKRHGLKEDGIITGKTLKELTTPIHNRIHQLLINMERCRWVPIEQKGDFLAVNIPDFKLFAYRNDSMEWSCNVIVGKSNFENNTVIFNANLEYIVFSPYWNIPKSILIKETLPEIKRNFNYLLKHDMEIVNYDGKPISATAIQWNEYTSNFPYTIRQKPGKNNALGLIKFLFPNPYDIYMHDTPEKSLFGETTRTFSHGCIRLENPYQLARFLLRDDTTWTDKKINELMNGGKQTFVKLNKKVPVFIAYFTAWVDRNGQLNFRDDVYHHDDKIKKLLFID